MLKSQLCKEIDFHENWFIECCSKLKEPLRFHRKLWEYCYITQALLERNILINGRKGLGFGVGKEPLVSLFALHGCETVATDLEYNLAKAQGWVDTKQHSNNLADLNERNLCNQEEFDKLVTFEVMDMNHIHEKHFNSYDFTWSSCSFEHLGSLELGKQFIINQMKCLKPGGIAVHTTEFNLSSNETTIESGPTVLFRRQDIEWILHELRKDGHTIEIDFTPGVGNIERHVDIPPYTSNHHLRLLLGSFISTSIGLIIKKKSG